MATTAPILPPQPVDSESEESQYIRVKDPSDELRYTLDCYEPSQALSSPEVESFPPESHYATITQWYSSGYATCSSDQRTIERHSRTGVVRGTESGHQSEREIWKEGASVRPTASLGASVDTSQARSTKLSLESSLHSQPSGVYGSGDIQPYFHESEPSHFRSRPLLAIMGQLQDLNPVLCDLLKEADSHLHRGHLEKAIKCLEKSLLQSNEYPRLQSLVWMLLGMVHIQLRQYKKASVCYLRYLAFCRDKQDFPGMTKAECKLGIAYMKQGLLKLAGRCFMQYLENSQILQDDVGVAAACSNLGMVSKMVGIQCYKAALKKGETRQAMTDLTTNLYRAVAYFEQHLDIMEHYGDLEKQASAYGNLGACYELLKQHTQAIFCHNKRLEIVRILGDKVSESCVLCNLGNCFRATGKLQEALEYYHLGYELAQVTGSHRVEMVALLNLGATCELSDKLDKAVEWHTLYLSLAVRQDDLRGQARALSTMAGLYEEIGQTKKAQHYYTKLAEVFKKLGDGSGRLTTTRYLQTLRHSEENKRRSSKQVTRSGRAHSISHIPAYSHTSLHSNIERSTSKRNKLCTWPYRERQQHVRERGSLHMADSFSSSCRVVFENPVSEFLQEQYRRQEELASEIAEQAYLSSHTDPTPRNTSPDSTLCFPYTYHPQDTPSSDELDNDPSYVLIRQRCAPVNRPPSPTTNPPPLPPRRYTESDDCVDADTESTTDYESMIDNEPPHPQGHMTSNASSQDSDDTLPPYPLDHSASSHASSQYSDSDRTLSACSTRSSELWESEESSSEIETDKEWERWLSLKALNAPSRVVSMTRGEIQDGNRKLAKLKPTHSAPHNLSQDGGDKETSESEGH